MNNMSELTTQLYKIDFKQIIDNATNKLFWDKTWEIFRYGDVTITFSLDIINVKDNKLSCRIHARDTSGSESYDWSYIYSNKTNITVPLQEDNFNKIAIEKELVGKVNTILMNLGVAKITKTTEYEEMVEAEDDLKERLEDIANEFLDDYNVSHDAIREAYIDVYVDNNEKRFSRDFIDENRREQYVACRATFAYVMGFNERAESILADSTKVDCEQILEQAEELKQQLSDDDLSEYKENLEEI